MKAGYFQIALALVGFSVSLQCSAADETTTNPSGNSAAAFLSSLSDSPGPALDGTKKFFELFHLNDGCKISYKETFDYPANPALADALEKQWAGVIDPPGIHRKATLEEYSQRIRKGSQGAVFYTFYISKKSKLMVEKMEDDPWNVGYITQVYFTDKNITEVEPSARIATMFRPDASRYPELIINFPALHGALGFVPATLQMTMGKPPMFIIQEKNIPVSYLLKLDSNQSVVETSEVAFPKKKLSVAKFKYSPQSPLWPSRIDTEVTAYNGSSLGNGRWDLLKIEKLPDGFDFRPKIEANYRIVDKTASKTFGQ